MDINTTDPAHLAVADGREWEREVASYLQSLDFHTEVRATKGEGEHEIDVFAERGSIKLVVECKDWRSPVQKNPVRAVNNNANEIGADPVLAYTSSMSSGARELADAYGVVLLSAEVVRGQALTVDTVRQATQRGQIVHPEADGFDSLDEPIGPFALTDGFAESVAGSTVDRSVFASLLGEPEVTDRIRAELPTFEADQCVPVLSEDETTIDLYGVGTTDHEILPRTVERLSVSLE